MLRAAAVPLRFFGGQLRKAKSWFLGTNRFPALLSWSSVCLKSSSFRSASNCSGWVDFFGWLFFRKICVKGEKRATFFQNGMMQTRWNIFENAPKYFANVL
jgi:hypothetical protein